MSATCVLADTPTSDSGSGSGSAASIARGATKFWHFCCIFSGPPAAMAALPPATAWLHDHLAPPPPAGGAAAVQGAAAAAGPNITQLAQALDALLKDEGRVGDLSILLAADRQHQQQQQPAYRPHPPGVRCIPRQLPGRPSLARAVPDARAAAVAAAAGVPGAPARAAGGAGAAEHAAGVLLLRPVSGDRPRLVRHRQRALHLALRRRVRAPPRAPPAPAAACSPHGAQRHV